MKAYKGFNKDMSCSGDRYFKQYKEGKTYTEETADLCHKGHHACENPIDCLRYYPPSKSVYHEVELEGVTDQTHSGSKRVGSKITIGTELELKDIIDKTFEYVTKHCTNSESGKDNTCLKGDSYSVINGDDWSALNGGNCSIINGGYRSALNGGDWSALNSDSCSVIKGGYCSALKGGDCSTLNGGDCSALSGGDSSVVYGGEGSKVKGGLDSVLAIQYYKNHEFVKIAFAEVDGKKIKSDIWYKLDDNGGFVEVE